MSTRALRRPIQTGPILSASRNLAGILAMCAAMAGYITNDMFVKLASESLPTGQIIAVRGGLASIVMVAILAFRGEMRPGGLFHWSVLARTSAEVGATLLYLTALFALPIANATAIVQTMPLFITILAVILLKEVVGWRRWSAVAAGFAGMLLVVRPGLEGFNTASWIAVAAVILMAFRDVLSRFIPPFISSTSVTAFTTMAVALFGFALMPFEDWKALGARELLLLACASIFILAGYFFILVAARIAELSVIAPFRYTIMVWAIAYGALIWAEWPDLPAFAGTTLIVGSGLYVFHRERAAAHHASAP